MKTIRKINYVATGVVILPIFLWVLFIFINILYFNTTDTAMFGAPEETFYVLYEIAYCSVVIPLLAAIFVIFINIMYYIKEKSKHISSLIIFFASLLLFFVIINSDNKFIFWFFD